MSFFFFVMLFFCLFCLFKYYNKKIMVLLFLELGFVFVICLYFMYSFGSASLGSFFIGMIFLTFMVIDSVFGLCLLIFSSRYSTYNNNFLFKF